MISALLTYIALQTFPVAQAAIQDSSAVREIRINPRMALSQEVMAEDILEGVRYISLQTTRESAFGKIDQLEVSTEFFFILDGNHRQTNARISSAILMFKKSGEFVRKIIVPQCFFFTINSWRNEIAVSDYMESSITTYNFDGKLTKTEKLNFFAPCFAYLPDALKVFYTNSFYDETDPAGKTNSSDLVVVDSVNRKISGHFPFDTLSVSPHEVQGGTGRYFSSSGNQLFFHRPYFYGIYSIQKNSVDHLYQVVLPLQYSLPVNFGTERKYKKERLQYLKTHPEQVYDITNIFSSGEVLSFKLYSNKARNSFLYSLKSANLIELSTVSADGKMLVMPIEEDIIAADGADLITFMTAPRLVRYMQRQKPETFKKYEPFIQKLVNEHSLEKNPILILLKTKNF